MGEYFHKGTLDITEGTRAHLTFAQVTPRFNKLTAFSSEFQLSRT